MYNLKAKVFIALSTLWLFFGPCHADSNLDLGSQCSLPDNSTVDSVYQTNLFNLQNSHAANAPFYTTTVRKGANKLYGLTPCRGEISSRLCSLHQECYTKKMLIWMILLRALYKIVVKTKKMLIHN